MKHFFSTVKTAIQKLNTSLKAIFLEKDTVRHNNASINSPTSIHKTSNEISYEEIKDYKPNISSMMKMLYGEKNAQSVYDKCQEADPYFNKFVQEIIYDQIWNLPFLSLIEKSLVTISVLATIEKEEQLDIHLQGYNNVNQSSASIENVFNYMFAKNYIQPSDGLQQLMNKHGAGNKNDNSPLSQREESIIDIAFFVTKGDKSLTKRKMLTVLNNSTLSKDDIACIMRQQMIYCGCPCVMNGFAILNDVVFLNKGDINGTSKR